VGDLTQESTISKIADLRPDAVIHLVSLDHFDSEKEPGFVTSVNVIPSWRLLEACTRTKLKKFIYFSTIQVYGKLPAEPIDESFPVCTQNAYSLTHHLSEYICNHYNRKSSTDIITVRLSNSYGDPVFPDNNCWWLAINDLCRGAHINKEIRLLSDGTPQRDFIHGNDVCRAVSILLRNHEKFADPVYHISSGTTLTLLEIARTIQKEYKYKYGNLIPIITSEGEIDDTTKPPQLPKFTISNQRLRSLNFNPVITINQGIKKLFNYIENQKLD